MSLPRVKCRYAGCTELRQNGGKYCHVHDLISKAKALDIISTMFRIDMEKLTLCKRVAPRRKPKPDKTRQIILTDEEQRIINIEANYRDNYGNSPVRHLTQEEIAKLQDQVTPLNLIPRSRRDYKAQPFPQ